MLITRLTLARGLTTEQINKTCQTVYYHLHNIRQIRKFLTPASTKRLVQGVITATWHAFIIATVFSIKWCTSCASFQISCNVFRIPQRDLSPIHPEYCHITPVLLTLHWLPVKYRICYKIAVISFKAIYNLGPEYLSNIINITRCSRYKLWSNLGVILQDPTTKFKCTLGDRSFTAAAQKDMERFTGLY